MFKKTIKWLLWIVLIPVTLLAAFLIYATLADYKPPAQVKLSNENQQSNIIKHGEPFKITTFNIGYAGLDRGQDFFMDGGTGSRAASKEQTEANLESAIGFLSESNSELILLQEVDRKSSRSYKIDEAQRMGNSLQDYDQTFAYNYKVPWVPVPLTQPMGAVNSGLLTLSAFAASSHTRFDLPGKESWPVQLFELDRGFIESRLPVDNGKELVLVNLHLSAFDKGGRIRKQQLDFLGGYLEQEDNKGNYIIVGGDWNHSLPTTDPEAFPAQQEWPEWLQPFPETFGPDGYQWAVDPSVPTVRTLDAAYEEGVNFLAVIDGFFVSSNVEIVQVAGTSLAFGHSDHNPVTGTFVLQ
ncbi:endonuclease/exonuclease/phosphatase family protein [Paenibacillus sp. 1011MAR3C5]|uniref:endonuclease/exonuclease/phosphatase family protein n=1 Tax=Paenibacillus sp. 1011MAR3C5 TaxID=1675787 RepID=UPI000E6BA2BF|nr:endonuclease/exonuclease/phosphatase family protein [Paenibacillus sp. 1011MAR3C5]RJE86229.1 endonuclease/exonuclease/phosphatase family protein [Paenibacillus sp. 1011MAR3C5]